MVADPDLANTFWSISGLELKTEVLEPFSTIQQKRSKECQGIAGKVRQQENELVISDLPDINGLNLENFDITKNNRAAKEVKEYLRRSFVENIQTLQLLHIKARHFYGNILYNKISEPVGVLVIDSIQETSPFDEATVAKLAHYTKLLNSTF